MGSPEPPPGPGDPGFVGPVAPGHSRGPLGLESLLTVTPALRATGVAAGALDLSLPTDEELLAASAPNPYLERDRVNQGNVAEILDLAADFAAAGGDMTAAAEYSLEAQRYLAENFTNDGTPVYDQATHLAALPKDFFDAGPRMIQLARRLDLIADDLDTTQNQADTTWTTMLDNLDAKRAAFATQVQAALNAQGLIPFAAVAGLLATRDTHASFMQVDVNTAGSTMDKRRKTYEGTLADGMKLLADFGYIPPEELDAGPGEPEYTPVEAAADGAALDAIVDDVTVNGADMATLPAITATLDQIAQLNAAEAAGATLTEQQQAYRRDFYNALGPESLARLEGAITAAAPTQASLDTTLATAANGITNLSQYRGGSHLPDAVTTLLPGFGNLRSGTNPRTGQPEPPLGTPNDTRLGIGLGPDPYNGEPWKIDGLTGYQGISNLLGKATVAPGTEFAHGLGESAIRAQNDLNDIAAEYISQKSVYHVDGTSDLPTAAKDRLDELYALGEQPSNRLLDITARDTTASQALLGDPTNRHSLIDAGWTDGTGAAQVITTATKPVQPTEIAAERSAQISRDLFTELGDNPTGWRELIPKGSDVSNTLTELAASRIDTFAYPHGGDPVIQPSIPNPDGTWTAGVRLDSSGGAAGGDERTDFLKFVATGADVNDPNGDPDMRRIHTAVDLEIVRNIENALSSEGSSTYDALSGAGELSAVVDRAQLEALIDRGNTADQAAAQLAQDGATSGTTAVRVGERIAAVAATSLLPSPIAPYVKDSFNAFFDSAILGIPPAPEPETEGQAAAYIAASNETFINERAYLVVEAKLAAGALSDDLPATVFDNGRLRDFEDIAAQPGNPITDLRRIAAEVPANTPEWSSGYDAYSESRNSYDPSTYLPQAPEPLPTPAGLNPRPRYEGTP